VLTNTAKHAGASVVDLTLTADENRLRVEIHDDGAGGACVGSGSGLVSLIDRVEALGGLRLHSPPRAGTTVTITLPLGLPGPIQPAPPLVRRPPAER
jgi:signal transduction histidine kinase